MEKFGWMVSLGDPVILFALLLGGGLPILLLPGPPGQLLAGAVVTVILVFNHRIDRSVKRLPVRNGPDAIRGKVAVVVEPLSPEGLVRCEGEVWRAVEVHGRRVNAGEQVRVIEMRGLKLRVRSREKTRR